MLIGYSYLTDFAVDRNIFWKVVVEAQKTIEEVLSDLEDDKTQRAQWQIETAKNTAGWQWNGEPHSPQWLQKRDKIFEYLFQSEGDAGTRLNLKALWGIDDGAKFRERAFRIACMHGYVVTVQFIFKNFPAPAAADFWEYGYTLAVRAHQQRVSNFLWHHVVELRTKELRYLLYDAIKVDDLKLFQNLLEQSGWDDEWNYYFNALETESVDIVTFFIKHRGRQISEDVQSFYNFLSKDNLRMLSVIEQYSNFEPREYVVYGGPIIFDRYSKYITPENAEDWLIERSERFEKFQPTNFEKEIDLLVSMTGKITGRFLKRAKLHHLALIYMVEKINNVSDNDVDFRALVKSTKQRFISSPLIVDQITPFFDQLLSLGKTAPFDIDAFVQQDLLDSFARLSFTKNMFLFHFMTHPTFIESVKQHVFVDPRNFTADIVENDFLVKFLSAFPMVNDAPPQTIMAYMRIMQRGYYGLDRKMVRIMLEMYPRFFEKIIFVLVDKDLITDNNLYHIFHNIKDTDVLDASIAQWTSVANYLLGLSKFEDVTFYRSLTFLLSSFPIDPAGIDMTTWTFGQLLKNEDYKEVATKLMELRVPFDTFKFMKDFSDQQVLLRDRIFLLQNIAKHYRMTVFEKEQWQRFLTKLKKDLKKNDSEELRETITLLEDIIAKYKPGAEPVYQKKRIIKQQILFNY